MTEMLLGAEWGPRAKGSEGGLATDEQGGRATRETGRGNPPTGQLALCLGHVTSFILSLLSHNWPQQ